MPRFWWLSCIVICATASTACSQSLMVRTSDSTAPGSKTHADVVLSSTGARSPLIVQWDMPIPNQHLQLDNGYPVVSESAKAAGKELHCRSTWKKPPKEALLRCMVMGGQNVIPDGPIATLRFTVAPMQNAARVPLVVDNIDVLLPNMERVRGKKAESMLTVVP